MCGRLPPASSKNVSAGRSIPSGPASKSVPICWSRMARRGRTIQGPERTLHQRLTSLIDLLKVLEGVSEALLPLVRNRDVDQIEQLLAVALRRGESESTPSSSDPS